ncbi:MAG: methyltransferase [Halosimplex sp.]
MTAPGDPLVLGSRTDSDRDRFRFHTADGVPATDGFCPGELLALEHLWDRDLGRLRVVDPRYGVVGVVLAEVADGVEFAATSARSAGLCRRNLAANEADATVDIATGLPSVDGASDLDSDGTPAATRETAATTAPDRGRTDGGPRTEPHTAVYVPRAYDPIELGRRRILGALAALAPGGSLFVAARPETGLRRYEDSLAETAETTEAVGTRDDWALLRAERPPTVETPADPPFDRLRARVDGVDLPMVTAPGLFAPTGLDDGTRLLAETIEIADGYQVLDLCCGYGPLGAYAGSVADCDLWCSDGDALATACARRTLEANDVDGRVVTADCVAGVADRTFDTVLCNPPTHAGDGVLADLFDGVRTVLARDGRFRFVHHRSLDLSAHAKRFDRVETVATGPEHVVRLARR